MEWTTVEWPLGGVDAFTDAKHVQPGKLAQVINGRFDAPPGIKKRFGFTTLTRSVNDVDESTTPPAITEGVRLDFHLNEPILYTQRDMYGYSFVLNAWTWKGAAGDALMSKEGGYYDHGTDLQMCTTAINASYVLKLWGTLSSDGAPAFTANVADFTGVVVTKATEDYLFDARCFAMGQWLYIIKLNSSVPSAFQVTRVDTTLSVVIIPTTQNFSPSVDVGQIEGGSARLWDAREMERASPNPTRRFLLVYMHNDAGGNTIRVKLFDNGAPPVEIWTRTISEVPEHFLTVWGREGDQVFVAWGNASNQVRCIVLNESTGVPVGAAITVSSMVGGDCMRGSFVRVNSTDVLLAWEWAKQAEASPPPPPSMALPFTEWRMIRNSSGATLQGSERTLYDCAMVSRPFADTAYGRYYVAVCFHEAEQGTGFIIEIGNSTDGATDPRWVATFGRLTTSGFLDSRAAAQGNGTGGLWNVISNAYDIANPSSQLRAFHFSALQKHKFTKVRRSATAGDIDEIRFHRGAVNFAVDFGSVDRFQAASWDRGYLISGGRPSWYDTFQVAEHGFAWYPSYDRDRSDATTDDIVDDAGGTLIIGGDVQVVATFEHEDVNGMRTISGTSKVMTEAITANSRRLRLSRTTSLLTDRQAQKPWLPGTTRPREIYYRTTQGGTDFFRAHAHTGFQISPDNTEDQVFIAETGFADQSDTEITDNEQLYTTGDILINDGTPPCRFAVTHGDRMWLGGLENRKEMWFSQPYVGTETPRYNGNLRLRFPVDIINAISMDDKLVCFATDRIFIVTGEGCSAAGGVDIGFRIQLVTSDVGLRDLRSLTLTPFGIMFRSEKGIYLLDRGLALDFIGRDVTNLLGDVDFFGVMTAAQTVVAAVTDTRRKEVHFVCTPLNVEQLSFVLVYNYDQKVWAKDELTFRASGAAMLPPSQRFAVLQDNGMVHVRSTAWADPDDPTPVFVPLLIETPWIKPSTLKQGWSAIGEILLVGQLPGVDVDCQIRVQVFYDYESTPSENILFTEAELQVLVESITSSNFQISLTPSRQTCQVFKVRVTDEDSGDGPDEGPTYQSLVFKVGREEGTARTRKEARH